MTSVTFYIVVEGKRTEKRVFRQWIPALRPELRYVGHPSELGPNSFTIVSGNGYPSYLRVVRDAAVDVQRNPQFGTLMVSIDSEEVSPRERRDEVFAVIRDAAPTLRPIVIVQDQCIETWALGNRRMVRRFPVDRAHRQWKAHYDVWELDPEGMPAHRAMNLNRAQSALAYFRAAIKDRNASLSYSKSNPAVLSDPAYLQHLMDRSRSTGHMASFVEFCDVFS